MAEGIGRNRVSWPTLAGLCGAAVLSAASVHLTWAAVFNPGPITQATRKTDRTIDLAALQMTHAPTIEVDSLLTRPIFAPSRTPPRTAPPPAPLETATEQAPPAPIPVEPPSYIVGGVVITPTYRKTLLRIQPRDRGQWVGQGETTAEGWRISAVEHEAVVLDRDGISFTLSLRRIRGE